jgi:exopolysaccharide biosynthesis protein
MSSPTGPKRTVLGPAHIIAAAHGVQMVMLVRTAKELFTEFVEREAKKQGLKMVINGSFTGVSYAAQVMGATSGGTQDASESLPVGLVIQEGRVVEGSNSIGKYHFSQNVCGVERFSAGLGNSPASSCAAIGGVAPIVSNGLSYGTFNAYKAGAPAGLPTSDRVDPKDWKYLTQKSNAMFIELLKRGKTVGTTAVGYSSQSGCLMVIVQRHGDPRGFDVNHYRDIFVHEKMDNAVFLDGSTSSTLFYDGKFLVEPSHSKNQFLTVAVGFK